MTYSQFTSNGREIRVTPNQIKKHASQFTTTEAHILRSVVESFKHQELHITNHARQHVYDLDHSDVMAVINDCSIIEFNCTGSDCRVLLRCNHATHVYVDNGVEVDYTLCIVLSIKSGRVISAYCNQTDDSHDTLCTDRYDSSLDIMKIAFQN